MNYLSNSGIMKNYNFLLHTELDSFMQSIRKIWEVYGKPSYVDQIKVSGESKHKLVNLDPVHVESTDLGKWLLANIGEIENCKFFICAPNSWGEVHIDGGIPPRNCAINIPIYNCEQGLMNWFSNEPADHKFISNENTNVHSTDKNRDIDFWVPAEQMVLTSPALVRTNIWHNIDNRDNNKHRVVFSFRFQDNPEFDAVKEKLSRFLFNKF